MSKVFVIPDIHLKPWMLEEAERAVEKDAYDQIVFLGDVVDDWHQERNLELYRETFDAIIGFIEKHDNVKFCVGNHDISYVWEALESGYSSFARETVLDGIDRLKAALPEESIAFIHRIDNVLFSHAGLMELFVDHYFLNRPEDIDELLLLVNKCGKKKMWTDVSPIWARPQDGTLELYSDYIQVVGHTPVRKPEERGKLLTLDTFSTTAWGQAIGDQRFVWIDTIEQNWGYVET